MSRVVVGGLVTVCATVLCVASVPEAEAPASAQGLAVAQSGNVFHLTNALSGAAELVFAYGRPDDDAFFGDWDGDGRDTPMIRRGSTLHLANSSAEGAADVSFPYGEDGDLLLTGDWDGDGSETPAVGRGGEYHVRNSNSAGRADLVVAFGRPDDHVLVGDWDGDGRDTLGVRRGSAYYLRNSLSSGPADVALVFGQDQDEVLVGDWDGDGRDTLGVRRAATFHLSNSLAGGVADVVTSYGRSSDGAFAGDWDGDGRDSLGVRRTAESRSVPASHRLVAGVSSSGRYLVDERGQPILVHAETAWGLMASLTPRQAADHVTLRARQGFNAMLIGPFPWIEQEGESKTTVDGLRPFRGSVTELDERYWQRVDDVLRVAREHGVTMFLAPGGSSEMFEGTGYAYDENLAYELGLRLGRRYAAAPGVVWLMGVDYRPEEWDRYDGEMLAFVRGLRAGGARHPVTVQYYNGDSTSWDNPRWRNVYDLSAAYTYRPAYTVVEGAFRRERVPVMLIESNFEAENNEGGPPTTDESLRRQMIWTLTSGGVGSTYGHRDIWPFRPGWDDARDTAAVSQLTEIKKVFEGTAWWTLVPDTESVFLVAGRGTAPRTGSQHGGHPDVLESEYATAAISPDGRLGVVYVPTSRTIRLDVRKLSSGARFFWVDPASGERTAVHQDGGSFSSPGTNSAGDEDWLLVAKV